MPEFNLLAVLVAALVAFLLSSVYYAVFASQLSAAGMEASAGTKPRRGSSESSSCAA